MPKLDLYFGGMIKRFFAVTFFLLTCSALARATGGFTLDYYQAGGNMWYCSSTTTAPGSSPAGVTPSNPPLTLVNPFGSGVKLILLEVNVDYTASPAAASGLVLSYGVASSSPVVSASTGNITSAIVGVSTTSVNVVGSGHTVGQCYVAGQFQAQTAFRYLGGTTGAAAIGGSVFNDRPLSDVVINPGWSVSLQTTSASALIGDFVWIEVPF